MTVYYEVYQTGSVADLLALIPKYPEFREVGESAVLRKLVEASDFDRARQYLDELKWAPSSKQETIKEINRLQPIATEDTAAEILKEGESLRDESETFYYLFRMATDIGPANRQTTVKLLDRASELLDRVLADKHQLQYRIGIAARYCQVKSDRCFTMMEPVIPKLNELVAAAIKLNGYDKSLPAQRRMEHDSRGRRRIVADDAGPECSLFWVLRLRPETLHYLRGSSRGMMAQWKLAQGVLEGPPKKPLFANDEQ